ncbi:VP1 [Grifec polyomavirus GB3]|nr:VP1 [Grifec polyomavirus GB3]
MKTKRKAPTTRGGNNKRPCIPRPIQVPRLIIKGGVTVLDIRQCPDATMVVEFFLNPRAGDPNNPGYSMAINNNNNNQPPIGMLPRYSVGRINLPQPNDDLTCENLIMWEAIQVKTEVVGLGTLLDMHSRGRSVNVSENIYSNYPIMGPSFHFFAVGGDPLGLQAIEHDGSNVLYGNVSAPKKTNPTQNGQVMDTARRSRCDKDDYFPIEFWHPDPFSNDNTRYYGNFTGGLNTPPVLSITNTVTTILLDENGVGPLCKGNHCYVTCCDIVGMRYDTTTPAQKWRLLPRVFTLTFRQRMVKNPYPINQLINNLYENMTPNFRGQSSSQIDDVKVYQGLGPLSGDSEIPKPPECCMLPECQMSRSEQYQCNTRCSCTDTDETTSRNNPETAAAAAV